MHVMIYVYVVPYCFLIWIILYRDANHLRRRKQRNQRLKARMTQNPLLFPQQNSIQHSGDLDLQPSRRGFDSNDSEKRGQDESETTTEYDTGSYIFPSAQALALRRQVQRYSGSDENESEDADGTFSGEPRSVDKKDPYAALALNESLKQILRERTNPIQLLESRSVRFIRKIGVGGYGEVYLGEWHGLEVAVKRFVSEQSEKNFLKEIEVIRYVASCPKKLLLRFASIFHTCKLQSTGSSKHPGVHRCHC